MNNGENSSTPRYTSDLDEVSYLRMYSGRSVEKSEQPKQANKKQPLIDIVTPQPKAFFAYLRMPKNTASAGTKSTKRITRTRKASNTNKGKLCG